MTFLHRVTCCAILLALALAPRAAVGQTLMNLAGGFASSRIEGGGVEDFAAMQSRSGLYVMITADIPLLGSTLAIAPGGAFLDRGFKWFQGDLENSLKLTYLQAVAPLRVAFPVAGPVGVHLFAGPGIGIAFGCQFNQQDGPTERIIDCTNDEFGFKSMDVVALGGGGLFYAMP